ncbi:MAG TPA: hypothetical protein VFV05_16895 [Methylomirabilota bacterium]|nr:hypothetical protein [Methylomirabilota bacterium]
MRPRRTAVLAFALFAAACQQAPPPVAKPLVVGSFRAGAWTRL